MIKKAYIKHKIRKGDTVVVITGKDKGKKGAVLSVNPSESLALVRGINVVLRHTKPTQSSDGGILRIEKPIHISNLAILDPKLDKPTKIGFKFLEGGQKIRYSKLSGEVIKLQN